MISVIGKRARQRSSKQASSAGMKTYYKGMLRVNLENGVVSVVEAPVPERPAGYALLRLLVASAMSGAVMPRRVADFWDQMMPKHPRRKPILRLPESPRKIEAGLRL